MESSTQTQNQLSQWVPSIPLPYYGIKKRCECGISFWTMEGYQGHCAYKHILYPEAKR